ncbi:MAG: cysteine desulfurase [Legionellales bacterium]|nr:cysteine desulfurase [Legionellales bacterium]
MTIYFDHNATTPIDSRVVEAMLPYWQHATGNPSSMHAPGRLAKTAIETARAQVAQLVNAKPHQVIFTGNGSEANNLAIKGWASTQKGGKILLSAIEHKSVLLTVKRLTQQGFLHTIVGVDQQSQLLLDEFEQALQQQPNFISLMRANNETGTLFPIQQLAAKAKQVGCIFHTDAVQAAGKIRIDMSSLGVDLLSLAAHKFGGPQGMGALIVNDSIELQPLIDGGGQERGLRSGTLNVAGIVGMGKAAELAYQELTQRHMTMLKCQHHFEEGLATIPGITLLAAESERLPNTSLIALKGIDSETLVMNLDQAGFAVSAGAACGKTGTTHVVKAMQLDEGIAESIVRVSFSAHNTPAEIDQFLSVLQQQSALAQRMAF